VTWSNPTTKIASRLEIYAAGTGVKTLGSTGNSQIFAHLFAPQADISLGGTADFFGWAVGKSLTYKGNSTYSYDGSKLDNTPFRISLVR
jgi:hypothetical protein